MNDSKAVAVTVETLCLNMNYDLPLRSNSKLSTGSRQNTAVTWPLFVSRRWSWVTKYL
ncbi:hypothetical protein BDD12DRAFT_101941 [Trichophaea hybrida]|nr:hypothetical protein BDD12DRAFT_101941 [Trichophaea hybrida]